jgi:hypothetical protein
VDIRDLFLEQHAAMHTAAGAFGVRTEALSKGFPGRPRSGLLSAIALFHSAGHMGEAATVRSAGGFGTGI